jgi:hypothetical protein
MMRAMRGALRLFLAGLLVSSALAIPAPVDDTESGEETDDDTPRWRNLFGPLQFPRGPPQPNRGRQGNPTKTVTKTKTVHDVRTVTDVRTEIRTVTEREPGPGRTVTITHVQTITEREGRTIIETKTIDEYRPTYITQYVPTYITGGATTVSSILMSTVTLPGQTQYITDIQAPISMYGLRSMMCTKYFSHHIDRGVYI